MLSISELGKFYYLRNFHDMRFVVLSVANRTVNISLVVYNNYFQFSPHKITDFIAISPIINQLVCYVFSSNSRYLLFLLTVFCGISAIIYICKRVRLKSLSYISRNTLILFAIYGVWIEAYKKSLGHIGVSLHDMYGLYCYIGTVVVLAYFSVSLLALRRVYSHYDSAFETF